MLVSGLVKLVSIVAYHSCLLHYFQGQLNFPNQAWIEIERASDLSKIYVVKIPPDGEREAAPPSLER